MRLHSTSKGSRIEGYASTYGNFRDLAIESKEIHRLWVRHGPLLELGLAVRPDP